MNFIFLLLSVLFSPAASAEGAPIGGACIRFVYADAANAQNQKLPVYACREIVNNRAVSCEKVGSLDIKKMNHARDEVLKKMWAYGQGMLAAYSCQLGVLAAPLMLRPLGAAIGGASHVDRRTAKNRMREQATARVLSGEREPGSVITDKDQVPTGVTQACSSLRKLIAPNTPPREIDGRDAYNLGVNTVLDHFSSSAAASAVLSGDAKAIDQMYQRGSIEHREAVARFKARIEEERRKQEMVLKKVSEAAGAFYRFMTDQSLTTIAFGTSAEGVDNNLPCLAPDKIAKIRGNLCELAKSTAKIETYIPGDLFEQARGAAPRQIAGVEQATRSWVDENCRATPEAPTLIDKRDGDAPAPSP